MTAGLDAGQHERFNALLDALTDALTQLDEVRAAYLSAYADGYKAGQYDAAVEATNSYPGEDA